MSNWQELNIEEKIIRILRDVPDAAPEHHFGRPFLTAYQIAIEYAQLYEPDMAQLDVPIGGAGIGQRNSLAQYLARELSRRINAGQLPHIEGGFLSNQHLNDINFDTGDRIIQSSLTGTEFTLSMFRLRD